MGGDGVKIGWIQDDNGYKGGAELSSEAYRECAPADYVLQVVTHADPFPTDCDLYIVGNCAHFDISLLPLLQDKPVVKLVFDIWKHGDPNLRKWFLATARRVIMVSPALRDWFAYPISVPVSYVPCAVDLKAFEHEADKATKREGTIWLGRMWAGKGLENVMRWSEETSRPVDFYGFGPGQNILGEAYKGQVGVQDTPALLARYDTFVFLPVEFDPCPRSVIEAWAADCRLILNGRQGTSWWIDHEPEALRNAGERFWQVIGEVING